MDSTVVMQQLLEYSIHRLCATGRRIVLHVFGVGPEICSTQEYLDGDCADFLCVCWLHDVHTAQM